MAVRAEEIASILREQIEGFGTSVVATDVGAVMQAGDGVARVHGLSGAMYSELLEFSNGSMGIALNLEEESVSAVILGDYDNIKEGDEVRATGRVIEAESGKLQAPQKLRVRDRQAKALVVALGPSREKGQEPLLLQSGAPRQAEARDLGHAGL